MTDVAAARYRGHQGPTGGGRPPPDRDRKLRRRHHATGNALHACFVRSYFARARITGIDISEALALPGVHAVFLASDLNPEVREQWYTLVGPDEADTPRPPLAEGEVRFVGDPLAVVVAESRYIAEDALDLVVVNYDPLPPLADYEVALASEELVHETHPGNLATELTILPPDALDDVWASAAHVVTETIHQQGYAAVPMETRGLIVESNAASRRAHDLGGDPGPPRGAGVRLPAARDP